MFPTNARVVELGGDLVHPQFRPNLNCVPGPAVDIICDLADSIPLETEGYDGIFAQFILEHIRHARIRRFIGELHRVLKPGGKAILITANLYEQAKRLVASEEWADDLVYMVFGGSPDYPGNFHHSGFSPRFAWRLFKEAGFYEVKIAPLPNCATDMIIEAVRSGAGVEVSH